MTDFNKILGPIDRNKLATLIGKLKKQHPGYGRGRDTNNQDKGAIFVLDTISGEFLSGNLDLPEGHVPSTELEFRDREREIELNLVNKNNENARRRRF